MKVLALVLGFLVAASGLAQNLGNAIVVGNHGYIPLPPELVCEPTVKDAEWSPEGRNVLAIRERVLATPAQLQKLLESKVPAEPPESEESIVLWSSLRRTSKEIFKLSTRQGSIRRVGWFGGSDLGYAVVEFRESQNPWVLYRIAASTGQMKPIATGSSSDFWRPSPLRPLGLVIRRAALTRPGPLDAIEGRIIDADGNATATFETSDLPSLEWSADGARAYWPAFQVVRSTGAQPVRLPYRSLDLRTGVITNIDKPKVLFEEPKPALQLSVVAVTAARLTPSPRALLLSAEGPEGGPVLITSDFQLLAKISPTSDAVLYESNDTLFVRPLLQLDADQLRELRAAAERSELLSRGKQCALALIMYASDYDDVLPPAGDVSSLLQPYLKNTDLLQGFSYTFKGGPMNDIDQPAQTELGFVQGNGGRAIVYADGHVVWRKD